MTFFTLRKYHSFSSLLQISLIFLSFIYSHSFHIHIHTFIRNWFSEFVLKCVCMCACWWTLTTSCSSAHEYTLTTTGIRAHLVQAQKWPLTSGIRTHKRRHKLRYQNQFRMNLVCMCIWNTQNHAAPLLSHSFVASVSLVSVSLHLCLFFHTINCYVRKKKQCAQKKSNSCALIICAFYSYSPPYFFFIQFSYFIFISSFFFHFQISIYFSVWIASIHLALKYDCRFK